MEVAPRLAGDLRALYNFIYRHLNEANIERSEEKIDDCVRILDELRGAWEQIAESPESAEAVKEVRAGLSYEA
jgi:flagellar protein FliS